MIARSHTRDGRPVRFGNDPERMPGLEDTYPSYDIAWANLSNTSFRLYKHWIHEGGIRARGGDSIAPLEGHALTAVLKDDGIERPPMFWEHEGSAAVRIGQWELVRKYLGEWELYDMERDRTGTTDLASQHPERVREMAQQYDKWAKRCGVIPRERIVALMKSQGVTRAFWERTSEALLRAFSFSPTYHSETAMHDPRCRAAVTGRRSMRGGSFLCQRRCGRGLKSAAAGRARMYTSVQ